MFRFLRPALVTFASLALTVHTFADREGWSSDPQKAIAEAKTENQLLLIEFSNGNDAGQKQDAEVFSHQAFKDYAAKYLTLLQVDLSNEKAFPQSIVDQYHDLVAKYGIRTYPTLILVRNDTETPGRIVGYGDAGVENVIAKIEAFRK